MTTRLMSSHATITSHVLRFQCFARPCLFFPLCGRLRVLHSFPTRRSSDLVQPCVRPFNAVHMTAGHNALRGSGPDQTLAFDNAMARVGCPDRRIDRLCITCCSPYLG